jgi:uncharacterized GH25 family protein
MSDFGAESGRLGDVATGHAKKLASSTSILAWTQTMHLSKRSFVRATRFAAIAILLSTWTSPLAAHYLWVKIGDKADKGVANIYFEESAAAGDGSYMDHFNKTSKTYFRSIDKISPQTLSVEDIKEKDKRWLSAKIPAGNARGVECYEKFGVYSYGKTDVLLHYYARCLDLTSHEALHELAGAKHMALDIIPHDHGKNLDLKVVWKGKPAAGRTIFVRGPKGFRKNIKTDESGRTSFEIEGAGSYSFRTSIEIDKEGKDGEDTYQQIRHHATLIMQLPLKN